MEQPPGRIAGGHPPGEAATLRRVEPRQAGTGEGLHAAPAGNPRRDAPAGAGRIPTRFSSIYDSSGTSESTPGGVAGKENWVLGVLPGAAASPTTVCQPGIQEG